MKNIFPREIIQYTAAYHFFRFNKTTNILYFSILLIILSALVCLPFLKIEITLQAKGIFRSFSESVQLTSPVVARVVKTSLAENEPVTAGDTLVWLHTGEIEERVNYLNSLMAQNRLYLSDIANILMYKYQHIQTDLFRTRHALYRQKLSDLRLKTSLLEKAYQRALTLYQKEVIPLTEIEQKKYELDQIREEQKLFVRQSRNEWQQAQIEYQLQNRKYKNEISGLTNEMEKYYITAPLTGYISDYSGIQPGSFLTVGQSIAFLHPDDRLIAESLVLPRDIGYLKPGMKVVYQVDAFNYNQWGFASGEILDISKEIYWVNNQPRFKVRSSIHESFLSLKNGIRGELKKGMTTTTRFKLTKRSLAQLIFDKADDWLNPKLIHE
jgi:membrane fusion protein, peptide pheromone/bacteriocin exporter